MTQEHPFGKSTPELLESLQASQVERNPFPNNFTTPVTTNATGEEGGSTTEAFDNSENGSNPIATTQEIGEEGGLSEPIPTTAAVGEEGGNSPVPTTATLGAEAGITPIPLPPEVVTTQAEGEEGGFAPVPTPTTLVVGEEGGDFATTLALGEEGGDFATTLALGEEGGDFATTEALGEEGGDFATTLALGEEGGDFATTEALGEEGGFPTPFGNGSITQPGAEAGVVTTLALGEEGENFNEEIYRQSYPGVNVAINTGIFNSGLEHYLQFGQFEIQRIGFFTGTNGNDIITGFGNNTRIVGVNTLGYDVANDRIIPNSFGVGEIDILVGSSGAEIIDQFILGYAQGLPFYVGFGNSDFALIQNFDVTFDEIQLPGTLDDYSVEIVNNSANISTRSGDLIGIIENVQSLDNLRINLI
ncbi:MAG: hypothetical protein F6K40_37445 [Okeania sp. SIO3I5]|uniref:hypothetical protein n=1 Tax=Okeania sp. SIO3I5 TaxID=2607805 RepID=UPI0013B633EE|nr:hypothetical protein [Okeania sp. SIO3I5]NEQ41577.1 hypothetical protein [Okeania sp. SIO3I5]